MPINVSEQDLSAAVLAETDGEGVDVAITAVSSAQVQTDAVQLLATHGRVNFFAGLGTAGPAEIDTNRVHYRGLTVTGTTGSSNAASNATASRAKFGASPTVTPLPGPASVILRCPRYASVT